MLARVARLLAIAFVLGACASVPVPTRTPRPTAEETPTFVPIPVVTPTPEPIRSFVPGLHIDGMATVVNDVQPVADPANPNRRRANRAFAQIYGGTNVYLVDKLERRNVDYWQVYLGGDAPQLSWVPQPVDGKPNLEEFHPQCPTDFPLTAELLARMSGSEALTCFGNSELTLSGALHCDRAIADGLVGGPILESNRSCTLDDHYRILGEAVTSLLEDPPVESIDGQYLIRGHFDDPGAQHCGPVSFGSPLGQAGGPPAPGTIMFCRILFVASNAIARD